MAELVSYTWESNGPLGLGIASDPGGIVVESVIDDRVARAIAPGMFVVSVGDHLVRNDDAIDDVIDLIKGSPRPLTITFEERDWDESVDLTDDDTEGLDHEGAPELSDAEPSTGSEDESADRPKHPMLHLMRQSCTRDAVKPARSPVRTPGRGAKTISSFIVNTLMTSPMFRQKHRNLATVALHKPLGVGLVSQENGDISVCAVPGEEAQAKKVTPGMILVEVAGELLTQEWKLTDVARVVKAVPDEQPVKMVFAFLENSGITMTKAEEEEKVLGWAEMKWSELDVGKTGRLQGEELKNLTNWVWQCYHPAGEPMTEEDRDATTRKLLKKARDTDGMDFNDFSSWFLKTNRSIAKYRAYQERKDHERQSLFDQAGKTFGVPLTHGWWNSNVLGKKIARGVRAQVLPPPIKAGIKWLDKRALKSQSLWQVNGNSHSVSRLVAQFDQHADARISSDEDVHSVTSFVLRFLQMIPDGVLELEVVELLMAANASADAVTDAVQSMASENIEIMAALCVHWGRALRRAKYNKLNAHTLVAAVLPMLTASAADLKDHAHKELIMEAVLNQGLLPAITCMIEHSSEVFQQCG